AAAARGEAEGGGRLPGARPFGPGGGDAADGKGPEPVHVEDRARPAPGEALHRRARNASGENERKPRRGGSAIPPACLDRAAPELRGGAGRGQKGEGRRAVSASILGSASTAPGRARSVGRCPPLCRPRQRHEPLGVAAEAALN